MCSLCVFVGLHRSMNIDMDMDMDVQFVFICGSA